MTKVRNQNHFRKIALAVVCSLAIPLAAGAAQGNVGKRIGALDASTWNQSIWISAADAPVITGRINGENCRAADGASFFVTTMKNDKKVTSAKWMTSGLGVRPARYSAKKYSKTLSQYSFSKLTE